VYACLHSSSLLAQDHIVSFVLQSLFVELRSEEVTAPVLAWDLSRQQVVRQVQPVSLPSHTGLDPLHVSICCACVPANKEQNISNKILLSKCPQEQNVSTKMLVTKTRLRTYISPALAQEGVVAQRAMPRHCQKINPQGSELLTPQG